MKTDMRVFALELDNDIKGIAQRKEYIESLIAQLPLPDFVVLPELALCSLWQVKKYGSMPITVELTRPHGQCRWQRNIIPISG